MAAPFFLDAHSPMKHRPGRAAVILLSALTVAWLARAAAAPTVTFELDPPNPVAGQAVRLRDTSPAASTSWLWDFGDGASASTAAPSHAWNEAGTYTVRLDAQDASSEKTITVSAETALHLLAAHPFEISIDAKDPGDGSASPAQAIAISDRFGWFSFPGLTNDPGNPEVTVKVLEAPTFGHYWIFWSAMTSLEYTMTVRDVATGQVQVYAKTGPDPCGGWDTESFPFQPSPTPGGNGATPTPAPPTSTPAPNQTNSPTRTRTPTRTFTTTLTATPTVTPTPMPSGPTQITLRAISWQWDFCPSSDQGTPGLTCTMGTCPYEIGAGTHGKNEITLHEGCSYELTLYNGDPVGGDQTQPHKINGHPEIGLPATTLQLGQIMPPITITIPAGVPDVDFNCTNSGCTPPGGDPGATHEMMLGTIHVAP